MKKIFSFALAAMMMLTFVACGDDDKESGTPSSLKGTEWVYSESGPMEIEGMTVDVNMTMTLNFKTETAGQLVVTGTITYMGQTYPIDDETEDYTYTYSNGRGTMTSDGATVEFTVDGNKLTMKDVDEETGEPIEVVFTRK